MQALEQGFEPPNLRLKHFIPNPLHFTANLADGIYEKNRGYKLPKRIDLLPLSMIIFLLGYFQNL